jgi:hypothetical protein
VLICIGVLSLGLFLQVSLEATTAIERPKLRAALATVPLELGDWLGKDVEVDPLVLREAQASDYLSRVYEDRRQPGRKVWLWINYSIVGLNLRHSPEVCLPSGGWTKVESMCRDLLVPAPGGDQKVMRLGYSQGELVQHIGFWYYIFGEGSLERYVRSLPVTSRSSHGRTTRGSGMTVEVFCPGGEALESDALVDFAGRLLVGLEPILPVDRANYYIP